MKIYYSIVDPYPAYRSDLAELFGVELSRRGCKVTWFMGGGAKNNGFPDSYLDQKIYLPFRTAGKSTLWLKIVYLFSDCYYLIAKTQNHDLIQCRDKYLASLLAIFVAGIRGIPFVYWCSYPFPEQDLITASELYGIKRYYRKAVARIRFFILYKIICRYASHIFVQSIQMKKDMAAYGVAVSKMTPVPMGVPQNLIKKEIAGAFHERQIVYMGTLAAVRKLDILLEITNLVKEKFNDVRLVIVGEGDTPGERISLERAAKNYGLQDNIFFTGHLPMTQALKYVESSAICLSPFFPSQILLSTSPTKILEYMALGKVVICSHHPEQTRIIEESGAGYAVDWSAEEFAEKIIYLLENPVVLKTMAARGPHWIENNRIYSEIASDLISAYKNILEEYHGE